MRISLLFLSLPILFSGCMKEKISKVNPIPDDENRTKITATKTEILKNPPPLKKLETSNNITLIPNLIEETAIIDALAMNIQKSIEMDDDIYGSSELITESLETEENWIPFTKKDEVIETAEAYLGVPYIWAANGPTSFDCSGFTKYVFRNHGITIPRYSGHQANVGLKVSFNELQKGDLVFFDTSKGFHGKVNHVGIYIGDHQFIHASSAKKHVTITSFDEKKFYKNRFLLGRRVINDDTNFASSSVDSSEIIYTN